MGCCDSHNSIDALSVIYSIEQVKMFDCTFYLYNIVIFSSVGLPSLSAYSFDGIVVLALLVICTCAYIRRVPKLKEFMLSEKKGVFGVLYKGMCQIFFLSIRYPK